MASRVRRWSAHRRPRTGSAGINGSIRSHIASVITHRTDTSDQPTNRPRRHALVRNVVRCQGPHRPRHAEASTTDRLNSASLRSPVGLSVFVCGWVGDGVEPVVVFHGLGHLVNPGSEARPLITIATCESPSWHTSDARMSVGRRTPKAKEQGKEGQRDSPGARAHSRSRLPDSGTALRGQTCISEASRASGTGRAAAEAGRRQPGSPRTGRNGERRQRHDRARPGSLH